MFWFLVILFVALSISAGIKIAFVYVNRYPHLSRILIIGAVVQLVALLSVVIVDPAAIREFVILVLIGFGAGLLFNKLKPLQARTQKRR